MRYICIPEPIALVDIITGETINQKPWPFASAVALVCATIVQKQSMDALAVIDLRTKLSAHVGKWVELTEQEYTAVESEFRKPGQAFAPGNVLQMGSFIKAVLRAPEDKPAVLAALDNGQSAAAS
jgi:hypothetical protein